MADQQMLVCYDIENSMYYTVVATVDGVPEYCEQNSEYLTAECAKAIGQTETRFITKDNYKQAFVWASELSEKLDKKCGVMLAPMTHKYLSNFYIKNMKSGKYYSWFAHSPEEDEKCFQRLIDFWKMGIDIVLTAHNLDYEYSYIRFCTTLLQKLSENCSVPPTILANGTHDIKSLEFVRGKVSTTKSGKQFVENPVTFKIMDTYLMTGKPISKLGDAFGIPKLEYEYDALRLDKSDLGDHDYEYNERDNVIAIKAIEELMGQIPEYGADITKLPMSATQHNKNICRRNEYVNAIVPDGKGGEIELAQYHKKLSYLYNMRTPELFQKFYNASGGGLIGVNPEETGKWHENCYSFDIVSAHPSQAFNRRFPLGAKARELGKGEYDIVLNYLLRAAQWMVLNPQNTYANFYYDYDYLLLVEFKGLREKKLKGGNIVNSLGAGKIIARNRDGFVKDSNGKTHEFTRQAIVENGISKYGKCRKADRYAKWFYGIDLIYHLTFYEFDNIIIHEGYELPLHNCDEYTIRRFEFYGGAKSEYKKFTKMCKKGADFETVNDSVQKGQYAEEYTKRGMSEDGYKEFLDAELLRIKGIFNGIFGQEYQNPCHYDMAFDSEFEIVKADIQDYSECIRNSMTHYCVGSYIAAWSRFECACMIWHCINNGGHVYYWATDSIKCNGVDEHLFDGWLDGMKSTYYDRNNWNFGAVDCENAGNPMSIYVVETLKYIGVNKDEKGYVDIHLTISGFKSEVYLKNVLEKYKGGTDFEGAKKALAEKMMPCIIMPEDSGKLVRDRRFAGWRTPLGQVCFGALEGVAYNLGGYNMVTS